MKYSITLGMLLLTMITAKAQTLAERINAKNATLIDVRTPEEFAKAVNGKTVEHIKSLQKVNLADKLTFRNDKQTTYFVKDGQNVRQVAIALGEGAVLKKHTTNIPATLIMVKGTVRFLINGEEVVLKDLDTYQIPVDVEHEVIGVEKENVFIVTKGN